MVSVETVEGFVVLVPVVRTNRTGQVLGRTLEDERSIITDGRGEMRATSVAPRQMDPDIDAARVM